MLYISQLMNINKYTYSYIYIQYKFIENIYIHIQHIYIFFLHVYLKFELPPPSSRPQTARLFKDAEARRAKLHKAARELSLEEAFHVLEAEFLGFWGGKNHQKMPIEIVDLPPTNL